MTCTARISRTSKSTSGLLSDKLQIVTHMQYVHRTIKRGVMGNVSGGRFIGVAVLRSLMTSNICVV